MATGEWPWTSRIGAAPLRAQSTSVSGPQAQRRPGEVGLVVASRLDRGRADEHEAVARKREARVVQEIGDALGRGERVLALPDFAHTTIASACS